jgi:hypothetical protein
MLGATSHFFSTKPLPTLFELGFNRREVHILTQAHTSNPWVIRTRLTASILNHKLPDNLSTLYYLLKHGRLLTDEDVTTYPLVQLHDSLPPYKDERKVDTALPLTL